MPNNAKLWCLHGNLQLPSVWTALEGRLQVGGADGKLSPVEICSPDLWSMDTSSFENWTTVFCHNVKQFSGVSSQWLMGYSLGGRLAMHAVLNNPAIWSGAIIISAHPGFESARDRESQSKWDRAWAHRFLHEPWHALLAEWDALPVFCNYPCTLPRQEELYSRAQIAHAFQTFSKGNQAFLTPALSNLKKPPILFVSGEDDVKYSSIGRQLSRACPIVEHSTVPEAGHRAPWENPESFCNIIQVFLDATSYNG